MRIIQSGRQTGKTTKLLQWMLDAPKGVQRAVIFRDRRFADLAAEWARKNRLPLKDWQFLALQDLDNLRGRGDVELSIDDLDAVLLRVVGQPVKLATLTSRGDLPTADLRGVSATMLIVDEVGDASRQEQGLPPHPKGLPESR